MSGGRRDPWLHFYEDFLAEYDPVLRKDAGAYYTPVEVVQAQVRIADDLLRKRMNKPFGFATGGVNVLDPAVGTGTHLLGVVEHALAQVEHMEGRSAVAASADVLGGALYGFEIMVGPYAVAALRLTRMLQQYGGHIPGDGVQVMLTNTLESPHEKIPELPLLYQPIGLPQGQEVVAARRHHARGMGQRIHQRIPAPAQSADAHVGIATRSVGAAR